MKQPREYDQYKKDFFAKLDFDFQEGRSLLDVGCGNPLFYPHMVVMRGHRHFSRSYFLGIVSEVFQDVQFKKFEAHLYPKIGLKFWKAYEKAMERYAPQDTACLQRRNSAPLLYSLLNMQMMLLAPHRLVSFRRSPASIRSSENLGITVLDSVLATLA